MVYLNVCLHPNFSGDTSKRNRVQKAVDNAADEINEWTGNSKFRSYGPKDHNWFPDKQVLEGPGRSNSEEVEYLESFASAAAKADRNNEVEVIDGDVWIIVDGFGYKAGYGHGGINVEVESDTGPVEIIVGRVLSIESEDLTSDPNKLTRSLIKHEIGHCFNLGHHVGNYYLNYDPVEVRSVSPMATSYVRAGFDETAFYPDTDYRGSGEVPSEFVNLVGNKKNNYLYNSYCWYEASNWCRHTTTYTNYEREKISSNNRYK
ncbi:MAG: hypothetical protein ABEI13_04020 [Candidatus Paceibacteria bacterium]